MNKLVALAWAALERNVRYFEPRFLPFGLVAVIGFPLYYVVWRHVFPQPYENLPLRLLGGAMFVPVMLARYWPDRLRRYLPIYWYCAILFALPFFFSFMLLKNNGGSVWLLSALAAAFLMVLLLDWLNLLIQFTVGVGLAWAAYSLTTAAPQVGFVSLEHLPIYLFIVVLGGVANYSSEVVKRERLRAMLATASTVAHELRTPLLGIKAGAAGLKEHLPGLLETYHLARAAGLPIFPIRAAHLDSMRGVLERIEAEADHSNTTIDMLLMNARATGFNREMFVPCSMNGCIETALRRYPFASGRERMLVRWEKSADFSFLGTELLMVHVLFNLLKNAAYHITKAGKGEISLRLEASPEGGRLFFRDTGPGIPPSVLPHVFTRFYSWSRGADGSSGAGIGLAYCRSVMEAFGGSIVCESKQGEFTEFVLTFPAATT